MRKKRKHAKLRQLEDELKELEAWVHNTRVTTVEWMGGGDDNPLLQSHILLRLERIHREILALMEKVKVRPKPIKRKAA